MPCSLKRNQEAFLTLRRRALLRQGEVPRGGSPAAPLSCPRTSNTHKHHSINTPPISPIPKGSHPVLSPLSVSGEPHEDSTALTWCRDEHRTSHITASPMGCRSSVWHTAETSWGSLKLPGATRPRTQRNHNWRRVLEKKKSAPCREGAGCRLTASGTGATPRRIPNTSLQL